MVLQLRGASAVLQNVRLHPVCSPAYKQVSLCGSNHRIKNCRKLHIGATGLRHSTSVAAGAGGGHSLPAAAAAAACYH